MSEETPGRSDAWRLASNLDRLAAILQDAYGNVAGIDLPLWAAAIRRGDGWGIDRFLASQNGLGRLDFPQLEDGEFGTLLTESWWLARDLDRNRERADPE